MKIINWHEDHSLVLKKINKKLKAVNFGKESTVEQIAHNYKKWHFIHIPDYRQEMQFSN